jgi:ribokinase
MSGGIVVVGSLNMDLVVRAPRHPQVGETIIGSDFGTYPGGKGANQAVAAARLGGAVKMIGRVGQDDFGQALLRNVSDNGVDTTFILRDPLSATGVALITVDDAGQNTIVVASGANARLTPEDVARAETAFEGASVLLLQLETPLLTISAAIQLAQRYGLRVVLNPAPAQKIDAGLLAAADYLIPNQTELALIAGLQPLDEAVAVLQRWGVPNLIVTLGEQGVLIAEGGRQTRLPAHPVEVVDTTAAGDAFVGAFAVALTQGLSTQESAAWGNAAGALAVTRPGAQPSLPNRAELDEFLSRLE